jgi:hypothetical protein
MLNSVQNRILAARYTSKSHNSQTVDRLRLCKRLLENWECSLQLWYWTHGQIPLRIVPDLQFVTVAHIQAKFDIGANIFVWCLVGRFEDDYYLWLFSSMRWYSSYIYEDYIALLLIHPIHLSRSVGHQVALFCGANSHWLRYANCYLGKLNFSYSRTLRTFPPKCHHPL